MSAAATEKWRFFLSFLGCQVTAVDLPSSNFNWMHGVRSLNTRLDCDVKILEMDLDGEAPFVLPDDDYGLVLFLGILYHLKNPFSILEKLARRCRYCMLSTRIAELTPKGMPMQGESLAYLLDSNEANNDPTNFWIFSETALIRLLRRSGWEIRASLKHGCLSGSNPSSNDADERMFLFLRSKVRSARADVKLSRGWWPIEEGGWCWVDKQFQIDIQLAENDGAPEFELRFIVHNPMPQKSAVSISCRANGIELGTMSELAAGEHVYRAELPDAINRGKKISLEFTVAHELDFPGESRDLGVIIPCRADRTGTGSPISFWIA